MSASPLFARRLPFAALALVLAVSPLAFGAETEPAGQPAADASAAADAPLTGPAPAAAAASASEPAAAKAPGSGTAGTGGKVAGAPAQVRGRTAFTFVAPRAGALPSERASRASKALQASIDEKDKGEVEFVIAGDEATFRIASRVLFVLTPVDAAADGESSLYRFSERRRDGLNTFLTAERRRAALQHAVLAICLTVFLGFMSFLLLRKLSGWANQARDWLGSHDARTTQGQLRWLVGDERNRWIAVIAIRTLQILAQALVIYLFLVGTFSLFEATRAWRERLTDWVATPLFTIGERVSSGLPTLLILVLLLVVLQAGWQAINVTADRIRVGRTTAAGITPELVAPAKLLLRAGLVLGALLLLVPLVTGDDANLFARAGYLLLQIVAVALLPLLATVAVGVWGMFTQAWRRNEWLQLWDGTAAQIVELDFFHLRLAPEEGGELRVPHLLTLFRPLKRLRGPPGLTVELFAPPVPLAALLDRLRTRAHQLARAEGLPGTPEVALVALERDGVRVSVKLPGGGPGLRGPLLLSLAGAIAAAEGAAAVTEGAQDAAASGGGKDGK